MSFQTQHDRIFGLDIIRAIAIIIVVLGHGKFILKDTYFDGFPYIKMVDGVDIFFVLSGFLIGGILLKEINKPTKFQLRALLIFWKRRWFRTLPNYYLILLLNYLIVRYGIINESIEQFNFNFVIFTQNFKTPFYGFFWESWSLSIEEWFYIISPVLMFVLLKIFRPKLSFFISTLIMITLPLMYRISIIDPTITNFWWDITFRKTVLCRLDSIGYGLLFAWVHFYYFNIWNRLKIQSCLLGIILMVFLINVEMGTKTLYKQSVFFSLVPISIMLLLPIFESYKKASGLLPYIIQHISKISYSMYLINLALVAEVIRDNFTPIGGMDGITKYFYYWVIVLFVSSILYRYFEKPITNLRDKKISLYDLSTWIKGIRFFN